MGIKDLGVKTGVFFASKRIGHASDSIELPSYVLSTSPLSPLEEHVLNEMGQTTLTILFIARAYVQPYSH
jgi:hypothetical protein